MHKFSISLLFLLSLPIWMNAQINIQTQDILVPGDTILYSVAQLPVIVRPGAAGENKTWDFTQLSLSSQYVDRLGPVSSTNLIYSLFFGLPGNKFCNLTKTESNTPSLPSQTGVQFSDAYNFYKNTATSLVQKGFGASLNGIPIPVPYSSPETVYVFPLNYDHKDTSDYTYEVSLPGIGYYGRKAHRTNHVDAWGTLSTDFGTFDVLRIRSVLQASDTIALDTLGQGIRIPLPDEVKYKWVARGYGWPLLEITASDFFGLEISSRVVYRDFKVIDTGIKETGVAAIQTNIYPNPASEYLMVETELTKAEDMVYELFGADGRLIQHISRKKVAPGKALEVIPLTPLQLTSGMYFMKISTGSGAITLRPCIVDNH